MIVYRDNHELGKFTKDGYCIDIRTIHVQNFTHLKMHVFSSVGMCAFERIIPSSRDEKDPTNHHRWRISPTHSVWRFMTERSHLHFSQHYLMNTHETFRVSRARRNGSSVYRVIKYRLIMMMTRWSVRGGLRGPVARGLLERQSSRECI